MPKMKTKRSAAKRFKITGRGKIKRWKSNYSHLRSNKDRHRKRHLRKPDWVSKAEKRKVRLVLPYE